MGIKLSGEWTISVIRKSAAYDQQIVIAGSSNNQDGAYEWDSFGTKTIHGNFGVQVQNKHSAATVWQNSLMRVPEVDRDGNTISIVIESDDEVGTGDLDFNDLVLSAETTVDDNDYCLWGQIRQYSGCLFNPCALPRLIIDDWVYMAPQISPSIRKYIEPLVAELPPVRIPPFPDPPPIDHRAIRVEVPNTVAGDILGGATAGKIRRGAFRIPGAMDTTGPTMEALQAAATSPAALSTAQTVEAALAGRFRRLIKCKLNPADGTLLRVIDYDPGPGESPSGPFYGTGNREVLGQTVTDDWGFYLFIFPWSYPHVGGLKPDVMLQLTRFDTEGIPYVALESSVTWNIDKIYRKDWCVPSHLLDPAEPDPVTPDEIWQYIGNLPVVRIDQGAGLREGLATSITGDGTPTYPLSLENAPFGGTLMLKASFTGLGVAHYRIRYRTTDNPDGNTGWTDLNTALKYLDASWNWVTVGPEWTTIEGSLMKAYPNLENSVQYSHPHGLQYKGFINTGFIKTGFLDLQIRGYDGSGNYIPASYDFVRLRIDNVAPLVEIAPIESGGGVCGLVDITDPNATIPVTFRVIDAEGHLRKFYINMFKCHNNLIGSNHVLTTYSEAAKGISWTGTPDEAALAPDLDGFVTVDLPQSGAFFTAVEAASRPNFAAVAIELWGVSRTTNGIINSIHWPRYVETIGVRLLEP